MPVKPKKSSLQSQISHCAFLSGERKQALMGKLPTLGEKQLRSLQKILENGDDRLWKSFGEQTANRASKDRSFADALPRLLDQALRSLRMLEEKMDRDDEPSDSILHSHS